MRERDDAGESDEVYGVSENDGSIWRRSPDGTDVELDECEVVAELNRMREALEYCANPTTGHGYFIDVRAAFKAMCKIARAALQGDKPEHVCREPEFVAESDDVCPACAAKEGGA